MVICCSGTLNIASVNALIPAKHRIDSLGKLGVVRFADVASVNPEVLQTVLSRLFSTEPDLLIARLDLASAILSYPRR
jgi:hypothetical protein